MIIIVGASKGLGKSLSETFHDKELLLISRSTINTNSEKHYQVNCNINELDLNTLKIKYSKIKIEAIFFTIGVVNKKDNLNLSDTEKNEIVNTNFLSIVKICEFFLENFSFKESSLLCFCSSVSTFQPRNKQVLYSSAKSALNSYVISLNYYLNHKQIKIRVANLILGFLDTEMNKDIKTLLPKKNTTDVALFIKKKLNSLNGTYYIPRYWLFIKIILNLLPSKIKLYIFNKYKF